MTSKSNTTKVIKLPLHA